MLKHLRSTRLCLAALGCTLALAVPSQAQVQAKTVSPFERQLNRIDLGLVAPFEITGGSSGTSIVNGTPILYDASTASGVLATLRYTKSTFIGFEVNYKQSRFTEDFTYTQTPHTGQPFPPPTVLTAQANIKEYTFGYVAHAPRTYSGFKPYAGAGVGTLEFKPTLNGGQSLINQARAAYYWNLGADYMILGDTFGIRAQVRQIFYKSPDFGANFLTSNTRTHTFEPALGFVIRF